MGLSYFSDLGFNFKNYTVISFLLFVFYFSKLASQTLPEPIAKFDFNNGSLIDEINSKTIKMVGGKHCEDRFGNKNNAIFLFGSESSYLNLGTGSELKPQIGTIAMWTNVEVPIFSGTGHTINPFILTKSTNKDDFYESYIICYQPEQQTSDPQRRIFCTGLGNRRPRLQQH